MLHLARPLAKCYIQNFVLVPCISYRWRVRPPIDWLKHLPTWAHAFDALSLGWYELIPAECVTVCGSCSVEYHGSPSAKIEAVTLFRNLCMAYMHNLIWGPLKSMKKYEV